MLLDDVQQHLLFLATAHGVNHLVMRCTVVLLGVTWMLWGFLSSVFGQLADFIAERGRESRLCLSLGTKASTF